MKALKLIGPEEVKERNIITKRELTAMCDCLEVFMQYRRMTGGDTAISRRKYFAAMSGLEKLRKTIRSMA